MANAKKPRLSEIARQAMEFSSFAIHISCGSEEIPHAIMAFDPSYGATLAARAALAFPRMGARQALFLALEQELSSDEARVALNEAHGYSDKILARMERKPRARDADDESFFAPEKPRRKVATLSWLSPHSIVNPSIHEGVCALHLRLETGRAGDGGRGG